MTTEPEFPNKKLAVLRGIRLALLGVICISVIWFCMSVNAASRKQWLRKATTSELQSEVTRDPSDESLSLDLAHHLLEENNQEKAYALLQRLVLANPNSQKCWDAYAKTAAETSRVTEAVKGFKREIELNPRATTARATLGTIYIKAGLMSDGLDQIETANKIQHPIAVNVLIWEQGLYAKGRYLDAWEKVTSCLDIAPTEDPLYEPLCDLATKVGKYDEAMTRTVRRLKISPMYDIPEIRGPLSLLLISKATDAKTYNLALSTARRGAEAPYAPAQIYLAKVLIAGHRVKEAKSVLERALKYDSKDIPCLTLLAEIEQSEGNSNKATVLRALLPPTVPPSPDLPRLKSAAEGNPSNASNQLAYAQCLEKGAEYGPAAEVCCDYLSKVGKDDSLSTLLDRLRPEALQKLNDAERAAYAVRPVDIPKRMHDTQ